MPYKIKTISSIVAVSGLISQAEIINLITGHFKGNGAKAVCWLNYALKFAIVNSEGDLLLEDEHVKAFEKHLVRLRVFNKDKELYIWRTIDGLKHRVRVDAPGDAAEYVESKLILNGTRGDHTTAGFRVSEDKGNEMLMPFFDKAFRLEKNERLKLLTRNYIGYSEIGQAGYVDWRFVDILK